MEHLTLPSVGASFKKWGCCTPILPKALAHSSNFPKISFKRIRIFHIKRGCLAHLGVDPRSAGDRLSPAAGWHMDRPSSPFFFEFFFSPAFHFLCKWSTLAQVVNSCASSQFLLVGSSTCTSRNECPPQPPKVWLRVMYDYSTTLEPKMDPHVEVHMRPVVKQSCAWPRDEKSTGCIMKFLHMGAFSSTAHDQCLLAPINMTWILAIVYELNVTIGGIGVWLGCDYCPTVHDYCLRGLVNMTWILAIVYELNVYIGGTREWLRCDYCATSIQRGCKVRKTSQSIKLDSDPGFSD
jgi:hypothetical protein